MSFIQKNYEKQEFQLYPMDIQICPIYVESFSYSNQKVRLKWAQSGVKLNPELKLLQYNLGQPLDLEESDGYMPEKDGMLRSIHSHVT